MQRFKFVCSCFVLDNTKRYGADMARLEVMKGGAMIERFFRKQKPGVELPVSLAIQQSLGILRQRIWGEGPVHGVEDALRHLEYIYGHSIKPWSYAYRRCLSMGDEETSRKNAAICFLKMESWILG